MTSGTKILLAVIGLFVGVLVVYYGVLMPETGPGPAPVDDPVRATTASAPPAPAPAPQAPAVVMGEEIDPTLTPSPAASPIGKAQPATVAELSEAPPPAGAGPASDPRDLAAARPSSLETSPGPPPAAPAAGRAPAAPGPGDERPFAAPPRAGAAPTAPGRTSPAAAPPPPDYTRYTVKERDTLSAIAESWFGDANRWDLIAKANAVDPNRLRVGQTLRLPPRDAVRDPIAPAAPAAAQAPRARSGQPVTYVIRPGDTLSDVAEAFYGDPLRWKLIYDANRAVIGPSPDDLKVGMKIEVPGG